MTHIAERRQRADLRLIAFHQRTTALQQVPIQIQRSLIARVCIQVENDFVQRKFDGTQLLDQGFVISAAAASGTPVSGAGLLSDADAVAVAVGVAELRAGIPAASVMLRTGAQGRAPGIIRGILHFRAWGQAGAALIRVAGEARITGQDILPGRAAAPFEEEKEYCASEKHDLEIGVSVLPKFPKDNTDRNRTSPFAFTGNKFEFRSLGSSESIAEANVVINTIVAQSLKEFADELESAENFRETLHNLIVSNLRKHNRIIFNGNGYAPEWVEEAARRGLPNYVSTVDALPHMLDEKNIKLFTTFGVFTEAEIRSRYEIKLENYAKVLNIEAETCLMMAEKEILPACMKFAGATAKAVNAMKTAGVEPYAEAHVLADVAERNAKLYKALEGLRGAVKATCHGDALECAKYEHNVIIPAMAAVREQADELETLVGKEYWPFPTYDDLLFNV